MGDIYQLYKSYEPEQIHPSVFIHVYPNNTEVALRPFYVAEDLDLYNQWLNEELHSGNKKKDTPSVFEASYFQTTLRSTNTQSLWGLINGQSAFQVDMYKADEHQPPFSEKSLLLSGVDVFLQLIIAPKIMAEPMLAGCILPACITHCLNHTGVKRVLLVSDEEDVLYRWLAEKARPNTRYGLKNGKTLYIYE